MTSKPQPDKLGRNMKALPSAMWNRAIPENDYIQLGTLRYGVRLSNTGLLDGGKPDHVTDLNEGNSRASVNSYEIANGDNSVHSVGGTSSISSNGENPNCCCIGTGGVEMPWTNSSYGRTKLPVPSSLTKNRKSSPFASTSVGSPGAEGQQQLPRYPMLAPGRTNNNGTHFSQLAQSHDHGSDGYTGGAELLVDSSYRNGVTNNNGSSSRGDSDHSNFSNINNANGRHNSQDHQKLFASAQQQQQESSSPRCSTVVCCYSNSFGSGSKKQNNGEQRLQEKQHQQHPEKREHSESSGSSVGYQNARSYRKQQRNERSIGYSSTALDRHDGAEYLATNGPDSTASGTSVRNEFDDANDTDVDDDLSALVIVGANGELFSTADDRGGSVISSGGDYRNGDDLNLNSKNALRQQQHLGPQQQSWPVQGQGGRKDVNINNFEKKKISSELHGAGGLNLTRSISARSGDGVGGGRNNIRKKHSSSTGGGTDLCTDDLSSTSSLSPRPVSPSAQQPAYGCILTHPASEDSVTGSPHPLQAHPPPIATPFAQRRRILQPPSSLPVVKSYSFHRVPSDAIGYCSPTLSSRSPVGVGIGDSNQLFDGPLPNSPGRNRSFRSANHARRLHYGQLDDSFRAEKQNGFVRDEIGGEALYFRPNVTRKSSLPVLSSNSSNYSTTTAGNIRNHKCSDALNEIRLQSLNKYCNKLLGGTAHTATAPYRVSGVPSGPLTGIDANLPTTVIGGTHGRTQQRPIDELEDLSFIDSSDLSSAGDDINTALVCTEQDDYGQYGRECSRTQRKPYPSIITGTAVRHPITPAVEGGEGAAGTLPAVDSGKTLASTTAVPCTVSGGAFVTASAANRNNYIDSSSDELFGVCSGVGHLTLTCDGAEPHRRNSDEQWPSQRPSVVKCRTQCNRTDSNANDDYQAARYGAELRFDGGLQSASAISTLISSLANGGVTCAGSSDIGHGDSNVTSQDRSGGRRSDTNNNYHRNSSNGDSEQQQQQLQQQHQQQQQKYTTVSSNNSAEKSVSVGGVGGEPGRPGGIGEQTPLGRAATDDSYPPSSLYATIKTQGYGTACSSPDHHAGLNCFGRSNAQFHAACSGTNDRSIMEKRNNTLDRLQRLVKKTTSSSSEKQANSGIATPANAGPGATKTERLRELTELLKGNRAPPVPPPRRSKHAHSVERTLDRRNTALSTSSLIDTSFLHGAESNLPESQLLKAKESRSVDIPYRFGEGSGQRMSTPSSPLVEHRQVNLRANVSTSNLEALHELPHASSGAADECKSEVGVLKDDDELFAKLSRPESRTIVGSYTQTIPFRSASFSQVDYSSGKYIRSALGALKNSILKNKDQQQSSVDSNTIPRQYCKIVESARSCSPTELCGSQPVQESQGAQPDDTDVAKLTIKKTELNINLAPLDDYGRYHEVDGKDLASNRNSDIETIVEDPVAEHNENVENEGCVAQQANISVMQASEMVLESLVEEGIPITPTSLSKDDECLQQATTCLIPVPVYDCVVSEWSTARPSEQWIDASTTEYGKFSDCLGSIKEVNENAINDALGPGTDLFSTELSEENYHPEKIVVENPPQIIEPQESVELSEDGCGSDGAADTNEGSNGSVEGMMICTPPVSIICTEPESNEYTTIVDGSAGTHKVSVVMGDGNEVEVVEVRKRHSNNEDMGDTQNCRLSNDVDEKRRLESRKSRRKGIYIQWPAIDGNNELESDHNDNGVTTGEEGNVSWNPQQLGQVNEKDSSLDLSGDSFTDLSGKDTIEYGKERENAVHSPERYLLDPTTPDSDPGKPIWPKSNRRQSLTYQSSDEKDDTLPAPALPVRTLKTLLLRSDSVSDNESDRASSRDRTSASPAPGGGDSDLRRYSKRPLRGPYGQMLEAEMKKPTSKVQYSEILEELTRNEGHNTNANAPRSRGTGSQSMDETNDRHAAKAGSKPRKTSANLPVPTHVRTASSPSKLSDSSSSHSASPSKRYLSNIEQRSTDSDKSEKSMVSGGKLESKKFSLDSHLADKSLRRGGSDVHEKPNKQRSGSSASDKQQKRSLDEIRLSQNSRTPSERSFTLLSTPETPKGLAASPELLAELLKGSSEKLVTEQLTSSGGNSGGNGSNALPSAVLNCLDTRTHVVVELFNTEKSYVESLQTIVLKYLNQLKSPENSGLVDAQTVDEIFFMVPAILNIHERFLEELRRRLDSWDKMQMIGDAFVDVFSRPVILDTYTAFVNNWNRAKDAIRSARQKCPAFARFLEAMAREHKGKLSLDNLLIKPVQKFPNYELIFTRLIKHTDVTHPDQKPLQEALKLVHDILIFLNCKEKEALENGQRETALRELEGVIEGMNDLVTPERAFLLFDLVSMPSGQVTRKERGFFLFNDLLVITSIKRRSGTIRKTNMTCPGSVASTLDTNKYKYLTKISLDDLEIVKSKDENVRRIMKEIEHLSEDSSKLIEISDKAASLRCPHGALEEAIRELQREVQRQLAERQTNDAQLNVLELTWNTSNGIQNMTVVFSKPEKRTQWEEIFAEAKQKLANSLERCQIPDFFVSVPIRKTRAGLQFTCASPTLGVQKDVWVCNSDGYVGQVCVLSLVPEPSVTSCNGVCNARILCVSSVPANEERASNSSLMNVNISIVDATVNSAPCRQNNSVANSPSKSAERKGSFKSTDGSTRRSVTNNESNIQLDSGSSSEDSDAESQPERVVGSGQSCATSLTPNHRQQDSTASTNVVDESENQQSTMWLGTEDGCIHVYNCTDNIRIKKNKIKIPHVSAVYSILYLDNRVFVSLANGDICVYSRDRNGWNVASPLTVTVGTVTNPVVKLLNVHGKLWCAIQGTIKVLNTKTLQIDSQIQISNDSKPITNMTVLNDYVWISVQNSAHIKCCHHESFEIIFEVNLAPSVNKMLSNCDDIIRQHKAACLRVTSLLACKDLIWVGTSAGVLLTIAAHNVAKGSSLPAVTGLPHGHTGHVRFLTFVESPDSDADLVQEGSVSSAGAQNSAGSGKAGKASLQDLLVISGGDGYEDFRSAGNNTMSEVAGREDSTNHLLLWKV
uniref:DH domain-containing protein n=1 Tax=Anopheles funestus TaxID=62324 RepID=A0A4Y0BH68_ANOFN